MGPRSRIGRGNLQTRRRRRSRQLFSLIRRRKRRQVKVKGFLQFIDKGGRLQFITIYRAETLYGGHNDVKHITIGVAAPFVRFSRRTD